jgi:hypothetical protein
MIAFLDEALMKKIIFDYVSGLVFSVIGFIGFSNLYSLAQILGLELTWGGDKGKFFWGTFLGLPVGSIFGFLVVDKLYFKLDTWNFPGMLSAFVIGILGNLVGLYLLDRLGGGFFFFLPFLIILVCTYSYNLWPTSR